MPIPTSKRSFTTYELAGLGDVVTHTTKGRLRPENLCHEDPMFHEGRCAFGQTGAAQSHLSKQGLGVGDIFLFFGLFAEQDGRDRHHRIFGFLQIEEIRKLAGAHPKAGGRRVFLAAIRTRLESGTTTTHHYLGRGSKAKCAHKSLRLSKVNGPVSRWVVPSWMRAAGLSYHQNPARWIGESELQLVARGQEFVADTRTLAEPMAWIADVIRSIER